MRPALYDELVPWYRLLDPTADHADEVEAFIRGFERGVSGNPHSLLELGAGAGNNAFHLKSRFRCTLSDPSAAMLGLSRDLNPTCEHLIGDMRTQRLNRTFDAVLVHDAVVYMTTESDLTSAIETAYIHTRPGGAAIFAPDCVRETFREYAGLHEGDDGDRSLRCLEWSWDPDPSDDQCVAEYAFLLREGTEMTSFHDRHFEGVFARGTWLRILSAAGYRVEMIERPVGDGETDQIFLCRRPGEP